MKLRVSLLLVALAATSIALAAEPAPASPADLVGSWSLAPAHSDETASEPGSITLVLTLEDGKLAGVAVLPVPTARSAGPSSIPPSMARPSLSRSTMERACSQAR